MVRVLTFAAVACAFHVRVATAAPHSMYTPPVCEPGVNMPQGDLPNMPIATKDATACAAACAGAANCSLFSFHTTGAGADQSRCYDDQQKAPSAALARRATPTSLAPLDSMPSSCKLKGGCCWLKSEEVSGVAPVVNPCACSGYVRVPPDRYIGERSSGEVYMSGNSERERAGSKGERASSSCSPFCCSPFCYTLPTRSTP